MNYPFDIVSYIRKKTFSIEARFTPEENESPLKVFDDKFSRYVFVTISDGKAATCNVHISDLPMMIKKTDYAFDRYMESNKLSANNENSLSIAYTTKFNTGKLKGKSPIEILIEDKENGKKILNEQYKWLSENLSKYPNNQLLMDAIVDASKIDINSVDSSAIGNSGIIDILSIPVRPLRRKQREDGKCFCYECKVTINPLTSVNYPVSVMIKNYYAPVIEKENGLLNVVLKEKDLNSEISNEFNMTFEEWVNALDEMRSVRDDFRLINRKKAFDIATKADEENRLAYSNNG